MAKYNDTFGIQDEWYLQHGPQLTPEEATTITDLSYRLIKKDIREAKQKIATFPENGFDWKEARLAHQGLLWKYQNVIKLFNSKPPIKEPPQWKTPTFKKPK